MKLKDEPKIDEMIPHHIKKGRLSWSGFIMYWNDPADYYKQYVLGLKKSVSDKMTAGSIFSKAFADRRYDYLMDIVKYRLRGRIVDAIRNSLKVLPDIGKQNCEVEWIVPFYQLKLMGICDGYIPEHWHIIENKFSALVWTQEDVDGMWQITFYSLIHLIKYEVPPSKITVNIINPNTGEVKSFQTKRTKKQLLTFEPNVRYVIDGILAGSWEKKI